MPLYEYLCDACAHRFEVIQKFSDALVRVCPVCGGAVRKLVSSPAIQFKGSGWYVTDYARKGGDERAKSDGAKSDGSKPDAAKIEGKPEGGAEGSRKSEAGSKAGEGSAGGTSAPAPPAGSSSSDKSGPRDV